MTPRSVIVEGALFMLATIGGALALSLLLHALGVHP